MPPLHMIALLLLLGATSSAACPGQSVYLEGAFKTGEPGWGEADAQFQVAGGEATFAPQPGTQTARWNSGLFLGDLDACVTIAMPESPADASRTYAGLLFWLTGKDDFYEVVVAPNGFFSVARKIRGTLAATAPIPWTKTDALKLGADAKNTLRLTLAEQSVVVRINDTEVARFRGQSPDAPSHIGLVGACRT